ncbi:MAG: hypothetical protein U5L04_02610 [Trueperaceae bacterium]|nr:hypothetical protein [Trueperaceae bacterium]
MPADEFEKLQGELDRLYERLDEYEADTTSIMTREYVASVRDAAGGIESQLAEFDTDDEGRLDAAIDAVAKTRLEALRSVSATRQIWESWQQRLERLRTLNESYFALADGAQLDTVRVDDEVISELLGQWPQEGQPGTGLAGRFYSMSDHHRRELADMVTRHAMGGSTRARLRDELVDTTGMAQTQAEQRIRDSTIQFSRSINARKADDRGYQYFKYFGPDDAITRPFCDDLLDDGPIFTREEIADMDNGQTGAGSVMVAGGGYRCRHHWRPVRREWFTDSEWSTQRAQ